MAVSVQQFLSGFDSLISLPDACVRVNQLADDPTASAIDIADAISHDPNLTLQLLRIANSPYYGFPSRVDSMTRAIAVIGMQDLCDLVLSTSIFNIFSQYDNQIIDFDGYWQHSIITAFIARQLAAKTKTCVLAKERLFIAGLLHDVGKLVMLIKVPEIMCIIKSHIEQSHETFSEAEQLVFGLGHAEIGAELLRQWQLPKSLQDIVKYHHQPDKATHYLLETSIVHIANAMAQYLNVGVLPSSYPVKISSTAWRITGLDKHGVASVISSAKTECKNSLASFVPQANVVNF